ncbi:TetR/AcrR family transcriptional regulator [Micromonospora sp. ALFpr18c]|uniref:TetR/AcrR family transcriptional regulator n=1 Tax=unclassified Micromonospora TaxID=2617518 RepID=UPI00124B3BAA|nr:TetR/AcrR family transcriptional regulator [Micromonospora sp. ALFpr18c]KAB1941562.1 TetR/AcrR family transcriptional regulator [Micromonospora sp. ALFpr18c]
MRSTAEARRVTVLNAAVSAFARTGFHATPVTAVAAAAGISEAYVFRLFSGKLGLFVAAAEACFARIAEAIEVGADRVGGTSPEEVLDAMGGAYAELIADRDLLLFQVQAQAVTDIPEIAEVVRAGYRRVATLVQGRAGASDAQVQQFFAYGQLCHLIVTAGLEQVPEPWARALTAGIRHP